MKRTLLLAVALAVVLSYPCPVRADDGGPFRVSSVDASNEPIRTDWTRPAPVNRPAPGHAGGPTRGQRCDDFSSADVAPEADLPFDVVFTADGTAAVLVNTDTDNVTFFDVATRTITHTVAAGDYPTDVAVTSDNRFVVVPNVFSHDVSIIDIATHTLLAHVPITGSQPFRVAVTPDSQFAVVGVINDAVASSFSVIDLNLRQEILSFGSAPQGSIGWFWTPESGIFGNIFTQFALAPDGDTIVLPDRGGNRVVLYSRATGAELASLPTTALPTAVDISLDGTTAVVSHEGSAKTITKINLLTHSISGTYTTSANLESQIIRITPSRSHAIAAISNNVIFVDLTTGVTSATISTGVVGDIELSFDGQYAFVSNFNARVIQIASQTLVKTIPFAACAEAAASPVEYRAVALNNRFRENIHLYNINGAAGFFEGYARSGEPPEGDATRDLAISADGLTVVANNNISENTMVLNVITGEIRAHIDTGDRPLAAAITPDGHYAVVCNTDSSTVSIIDLTTDTQVKNLSVPTRPAQVRIAPDGQMAYVLTVASGDRIAFIHLDGPNSAVVASVSSGETGSWMGPAYTVISGIELSPDGLILAVCASFDDKLRLIDTIAQTFLADVPVGDFPIRVAFTPNGTRAYVTNAFSANVTAVAINGPASQPIATIGGAGNYPFTVNVDASGSYAYVGNIDTSDSAIKVIDTASNTLVKTVTLSGTAARAAYVSAADSILYVAGAGATVSELIRINAAGPASAVLDRTPLSGSPSDMVFSTALQTAVLAQPSLDGIELVRWKKLGDLDCDCALTPFDIDPFVLALTATPPDYPEYYGPYPSCDRARADCNADGAVDAFDIDPFVVLLTGG
jgi:YVTN family beta-propeller protein